MTVRNRTSGVLLASSVTVADSGSSRRRGLLGRDSLEPGEGLWIVPCEAVHSFWMRFCIDVLYLTRTKMVRKIRHEMKPWRLSACLAADSVLELPAGTAARTNTRPGDQLVFARTA